MKTLYNDITTVIEQEFSNIKWIDFDMGQLELTENPPVAFPCVLLDFAYPRNEGVKSANRMEIEITFKIGFDNRGQTNSSVPVLERQDPLYYIDVFTGIIKAFSGREFNNYSKLLLVSATPELSANGIKIVNVIFTTKTNLQ